MICIQAFFLYPLTYFAVFCYRLQSYDRNLNFGADLDIQGDTTYLCPPSDTFRDINADTPLPMISRQGIQEYFEK